MAKREDITITKVKNNILNNGMIKNGDRIVVGVSGGPDSVFLIHILQYLREEFEKKYGVQYDLVVCHINHMIRQEAEKDEKLAKEYAEKYGFEFYSIKADVKRIAKTEKLSEEECGRNIRYEFFASIAKERNCNKIAVAHNACDNAETVIHNFMRGSGLNGLCGIKETNGMVIRPILNIQKKQILEYLDKNEIKYNIDKTNNESIYTRNKIRNDLLPKLEKEYNPNIIQTLNRMAKNITYDVLYLDSVAYEKYSSMMKQKGKENIIIDIAGFKEEHIAIKRRIILFAISELLGNTKGIENVHIEDICDMFDNCITGKKYSIGNKFDITIEKGKKANILKK